MSWERYDDSGQRWSWAGDDVRHLLVLHDGELREYHELADGAPTVHVYAPNALWDAAAPLADAMWCDTYEVAGNFAPWVRALDDRELIEWLMAASYASAT